MWIHHKFFAASTSLTAYSKRRRDKLFNIECPTLRMRRIVYVFNSGIKEDLVLFLTPVGGLSQDIMINVSDTELLGVLKKEMDFKSGRSSWKAYDSLGNLLFQIKPTGTRLDAFKKKLTLFSSVEDLILLNKRPVGSFKAKSGIIHEGYQIKLNINLIEHVDNRILLALIVANTGIYYRVFT